MVAARAHWQRRGGWRMPAISLAGLVCAAALVLAACGEDDSGPPEAPAPPGRHAGSVIVRIDAASGRVAGETPVAGTPVLVVAVSGAAWVLGEGGELDRLGGDGSAKRLSSGRTGTGIAADGESVWILGRSDGGTAIERLDGASGEVLDRARIGPEPDSAVLSSPSVALAREGLWALDGAGGLVRLEPATGRITARVNDVHATAVAAGDRAVWALDGGRGVVALDPATGLVAARVELEAWALGPIAAGGGFVWVAAPYDGLLWRLDEAEPAAEPLAVSVAPGASALAFGAKALWVANALHGTVSRIEPATGAVTGTIPLGDVPRAIAVDGPTVLVALERDGAALPAASGLPAEAGRVDSSACGEPFFGGPGSPDVVIVSDLPLRGSLGPTTRQMAQAVAHVLRARGFKAGVHRVAYQSCDDSLAGGAGFDVLQCEANAQAYAAAASVVGVIGTVNSFCALAEIPIANRAPAGPLAMISPLNSYVGLTRLGPGTPAEELERLYPTGVRNYVRVFPTSDYQAAALALRARELGAARVYVLDDGDERYGRAMALFFRRAASALGLEIAGLESWDPSAESHGELAQRVSRSGAQAVFLGGLLDASSARLLGDLRQVLPPETPILAPDGFGPVARLVELAGAAADGVYLSLLGVQLESLGPGGREFLEGFAATQGGRPVDVASVYAAQAAEVLLDAVARSDGTRSSVVQELFATSVEDGLLGSFRFDANGDTTLSQVTILQASAGEGPALAPGAVVDRVLVPPPNLVR